MTICEVAVVKVHVVRHVKWHLSYLIVLRNMFPVLYWVRCGLGELRSVGLEVLCTPSACTLCRVGWDVKLRYWASFPTFRKVCSDRWRWRHRVRPRRREPLSQRRSASSRKDPMITTLETLDFAWTSFLCVVCGRRFNCGENSCCGRVS
jgi:hypothetical protein